MKLSMRIIEQWILPYEPVSTIVSDDLTIAGIRLFSYDKSVDADYLYIGRTSDFVNRSQAQEVLLVHRQNVISLRTQELEDVFDTIMEAFVFYQKWEQEMFSAFRKPNPEQLIIDACKDIFGPMFFSDNSFYVTAFSKQYPKGSINKNWDDFWDFGTLSVDTLINMQNGTYIEKLPQKWDCEVFYEKYAPAYPYSMMISQENMQQELTGQLTLISKVPFQPYELQLAKVLKQALCLVSDHEKEVQQGSIVQNLFREFLLGKRLDSAGFNLFYQMAKWAPEQMCLLIILHKKDLPLTSTLFHIRSLCAYFPDIVFCDGLYNPENIVSGNSDSEGKTSVENSNNASDNGAEIICYVPITPVTDKKSGIIKSFSYPHAFLDMVKKLNFQYFCSYPSVGIQNVHEQYLQAQSSEKNHSSDYYPCALSDLIGFNQNQKLRQLAIHPALEKIAEYDSLHHTNFYEILRVYLRCERDRVKTAKELFVHKNTLVYRLQKIEELFSLNLGSVYEREYLMVSFLYEEAVAANCKTSGSRCRV